MFYDVRLSVCVLEIVIYLNFILRVFHIFRNFARKRILKFAPYCTNLI